ncbi:aldo/keto reductase [Rhodococcus sp. NPDC056743]|uniref:aldo/keto reductase n=1 Tax=Rhodococcus sp. NPDC056743 TaxID=3345934 RepID=UPI00366C3956
MTTVQLNNGIEMPALGCGVFQIPDKQTQRIVEDAIEIGYRLFDTAATYENEREVGRALAASGIPRHEFFVTTKLWVQDQGEEPAKRAFGRSLDRLGLDYLDLYLVHKPFGDYYGSWRALEKLNESGVTRAIGVSNFHPDRLIDLIMHSTIVPAVNQLETHVFCQQRQYQELMLSRGVQLEAWGPLAEGRNGFFDNGILRAIGAAHDKSSAQVALRWLLQRGIAVIPKSAREERMRENFTVNDFTLTDHEMAQIATLDTDRYLIVDHSDPLTAERLALTQFDT